MDNDSDSGSTHVSYLLSPRVEEGSREYPTLQTQTTSHDSYIPGTSELGRSFHHQSTSFSVRFFWIPMAVRGVEDLVPTVSLSSYGNRGEGRVRD